MKKTILSLTLFLALGFTASKVNAQISVGISVHVAPPAIPVYEQPACPVDGYLWIPGYWAWDDADGYYWVPGYWSAPPTVGFLWTPGYWGWAGGAYGWHGGYWGPHVGFYGGVNYGFGYGGVGYGGGEWYGGHFRYNTAVTRVNTTVIHNTYVNRTVIVNNNSRTSFNGGTGGLQARPTAQDRVAMNEHHVAATSMQVNHQQAAHQDRSSFANVNHGRPATAAVARPMALNNHATASAGHVGAAPNPAHANPTHTNPTPMNHPGNTPGNHAGSTPGNHAGSAPNHTSGAAVSRPVNHAQPQMHTNNQPRPQVSRPASHPAPASHGAPAPHGGALRAGGGGGGEHHHR